MSKLLKILATAKQAGSVNVVAPVVRKLAQHGHDITVYATGNRNEAAGFGDLPYKIIQPESDYPSLVKGFDLMLVGLSGYQTPDGYFLRAAKRAKIPTIAIQDQDAGYATRLGDKPEDFPTVLAVMDNGCLETIVNELGEKTGKELTSRARVIGWIAFDDYAELKTNFNDEKKTKLLKKINLNPEEKVYVHFTQNIHPDSDYMKPITWTPQEKKQDFDYEMRVTEAVCKIASDLRLRLTVKPHPGEKFNINYTKEMIKRFGFNYIPASACDTKQLILSADSISAGRSTCITEACLFDKNTGGILPDLDSQDIRAFPPVKLKAIPYTQNWDKIKDVLSLITSSNKGVNKELAKKRKRFSVDGKATQRVTSLVYEMLGIKD